MSSSTTTTGAFTRPVSRGEFELHVQSVRANNGLAHLIQTTPANTPVAPPPSALKVTLPPPYSQNAQLPLYSDSKSKLERDDESLYPSFTPVTPNEKSKAPSVSSARVTTDDEEPKTLARLLFLYGFLMPLFWLFGASIIFLQLKYVPDANATVEDPRTEEERTADLAVIRRAELRWAWRSVYAIVVLVMLTAAIVLTWLGATGRWSGVA